MSAKLQCDFCDEQVVAGDTAGLADAFLVHVRHAHSEFPYPDEAVRNYTDVRQRLTGSTERLDEIDALYRLGPGAEPADDDVIGVSCFIVAPPYRRHGVAEALLDRVIADAPGRGVRWIEAYPANTARPDDAGNFRGPRSMYEQRGFAVVKTRAHDTVVRRRA